MGKKILMKGNEALAEATVRVGCRLYCGYPITPQTEIMEYLSEKEVLDLGKKILMKGNEALAEATVRVGCRLYCGYPITPQTEIMEYLSGRMPQVGGSYIQAESEVSAISMLFGAASTGYRVITASSDPGFSLKQEGISYIASPNLPAVIVDVCRYGSGLGLISPEQGDYFQATKGGGHGDYQLPVFAPHTIQESVDLIALAFDKAEEYLTPVILYCRCLSLRKWFRTYFPGTGRLFSGYQGRRSWGLSAPCICTSHDSGEC